MAFKTPQGPRMGTALVHADNDGHGREVAPSISVTTTFRLPQLDPQGLKLDEIDPMNPERHVYSRYTQAVSTRAEKVLSALNDGHALTYSSGLTATYAALLLYQPKRIAITGGYHGCHVTIGVFKKSRPDVEIIGLDDAYKPGDLCWLETPLNPLGDSRNIKYYADKIHAVGGHLVVDSTFGPPPLQYPFKWGTDCVLHSGTKYFGGHSDLLCGVLVVKTTDEWKQLWHNRTFTGAMMGSLEAWLLLRSLRTLHLRVPRQSQTATALAQWLAELAAMPKGESFDGVPGGILEKVWHSSLQGRDARGWEPSAQMEGGWNATFSIQFVLPEHATVFPHLLQYFIPATSLGGVESLVEHRVQTDPSSDPRLIRLSVGVEDFEDLKGDIRKAMQELVKGKAKL